MDVLVLASQSFYYNEPMQKYDVMKEAPNLNQIESTCPLNLIESFQKEPSLSTGSLCIHLHD